MAQDDCILLSNAASLEALPQRLQAAYGKDEVKVAGDAAHWSSIQMSRRKLFLKSEIVLEPLGGPQLVELQQRLRHVYQTVQTEHSMVMGKLLAKVATSRSAVVVRASRGLRGLEDVVFVAAEALDAIIFWEGSKMLDAKGHLVMDFEGRCEVPDLKVEVSAELLDQHTAVTASGEARKTRTNNLLQSRKVPLCKTLPPIDGDEDARLRSVDEVAGRALALMLVAVKGEGLEQDIVLRVMERYGIDRWMSPVETAFIQNPSPSQQERVNHCWRYEGLAVMLWALGYVDTLPYPSTICDVGQLVGIIQNAADAADFAAGARMRPVGEILDQNDLVYRLHWAVVDARLRGNDPPGELEAGVVYERHYALNWLRCYMDQDWDEVSPDT